MYGSRSSLSPYHQLHRIPQRDISPKALTKHTSSYHQNYIYQNNHNHNYNNPNLQNNNLHDIHNNHSSHTTSTSSSKLYTS